MINCIIIDDEQHAIDVIDTFCKRFPYLHIMGTFTNSIHAADFIKKNINDVDLVFLDIEMPRFSGIDFLKAYTFKNVILVTAYSQFALESYQYGVIDFLLKPFSFDRFALAINKIYEKQLLKEDSLTAKKQSGDSIFLKIERNKLIKLMYNEICCIQAAHNFSVIKLVSRPDIIHSQRLNEIHQQLPSSQFIRVHKSYIINLDYFESLTGNTIKLKSQNIELTLGMTYRQDFLQLVDNIFLYKPNK